MEIGFQPFVTIFFLLLEFYVLDSKLINTYNKILENVIKAWTGLNMRLVRTAPSRSIFSIFTLEVTPRV